LHPAGFVLVLSVSQLNGCFVKVCNNQTFNPGIIG